MGIGGFILINNANRASARAAEAALRRRKHRRMNGYSHQHCCPVCETVVYAKCFCDNYYTLKSDINDNNPIGDPVRCKEHARYWIAWCAGIAAAIGLTGFGWFIWWTWI